MSKVLRAMATLLIAGVLAGALGACGGGQSESEEATAIELRVGDTHTVALESNPTTGYQWELGFEFDEKLLELVEQRYEPDSSLVGSGGHDLFTFRALAQGMVEFPFDYKRSWEDQVLKADRYIFNIGAPVDLSGEMSEAEAREIAKSGDCAEEGGLGENAFYNDWTGTWWIDLNVQKEGCSPACVVNAATGQAEINWRCTGALPPK